MGNTLGNKGGVGISMHIANTSFVCVNAHLAAHQHAVNQRNADFNKIARDMPTMLLKKNKGKKNITPQSSPKPMNKGMDPGITRPPFNSPPLNIHPLNSHPFNSHPFNTHLLNSHPLKMPSTHPLTTPSTTPSIHPLT